MAQALEVEQAAADGVVGGGERGAAADAAREQPAEGIRFGGVVLEVVEEVADAIARSEGRDAPIAHVEGQRELLTGRHATADVRVVAGALIGLADVLRGGEGRIDADGIGVRPDLLAVGVLQVQGHH